MAAPQQSSLPTYKETANIQVARTDWEKFDDRSTPGAALARLLGAVPGAVEKGKAMQDKEAKPGPMEEAQKIALAKMGAEADRVRVSQGGSFLGLMKDKEGTVDQYEINRAYRDADLDGGAIKDAYAASGLSENDDPQAFAAFVKQQQGAMFEKLKGKDPSYYTGYLERMSGYYEDMAKAHAGHLDTFITSQSKRALETRLDSKVAVEMAAVKEQTSFGTFTNTIMQPESGGNYNAFHGHANNQSIRFTDMTLDEVRGWQKSGKWKQMGSASAVVGKYQITGETLDEAIRAAGLPRNTKFTPAVQDKLFMTIIEDMAPKGAKFSEYLDGKITAETFVDKTLAGRWAGIKTTSGKGRYDGFNTNKATMSAAKVIASLEQLKGNFVKGDPVLKKDEKGVITLDSVGDPADDLENAPAVSGVSVPDARAAKADAMIRYLEKHPEEANRDDIEDIMSRSKMSMSDRQRVMESRDKLRTETTAKKAMEEQRTYQEVAGLADKVIRSKDSGAMETLRTKNYDVYSKLLELQTNPPDPADMDNKSFTDMANYSNPAFPQDALRAYVHGTIDQDTYANVMQHYDIEQNVKPVLAMPAIKPVMEKLKLPIVGENKKLFDSQIAVVLDDMMKANDGKRPSLLEIQAAAQQVQQALIATQAQEVQTRTTRPEYSLGKS